MYISIYQCELFNFIWTLTMCQIYYLIYVFHVFFKCGIPFYCSEIYFRQFLFSFSPAAFQHFGSVVPAAFHSFCPHKLFCLNEVFHPIVQKTTLAIFIYFNTAAFDSVCVWYQKWSSVLRLKNGLQSFIARAELLKRKRWVVYINRHILAEFILTDLTIVYCRQQASSQPVGQRKLMMEGKTEVKSVLGVNRTIAQIWI